LLLVAEDEIVVGERVDSELVVDERVDDELVDETRELGVKLELLLVDASALFWLIGVAAVVLNATEPDNVGPRS
jgi:hypothetical protein